MVGHSLGAAIALLDSVYLPLHVKGVTFKTVVYGLPRVQQNLHDQPNGRMTDLRDTPRSGTKPLRIMSTHM